MRRCKHLPSHHYCVFLRLGHSCLHVSSAQWSSWREGPCDALGVPSDPCLPRTRAPHTRPPGIRSQHPDGRGRFPGAPRLATRRALRPVGDAQATGRMRDAGAERSGRGRRGPCALAAAILWPLLLLLRVTSTSSLSAGERAGVARTERGAEVARLSWSCPAARRGHPPGGPGQAGLVPGPWEEGALEGAERMGLPRWPCRAGSQASAVQRPTHPHFQDGEMLLQTGLWAECLWFASVWGRTGWGREGTAA